MSKQDSLELKGIAILMMIFLHLFNTPDRVAECTNFLYIGSKPLALLASRICGMCVPIFIFITGYGLSASWQKKVDHRLHPWHRVLRLYGMYWTVFLLFIPMACYISPSVYPGSITELLLNFFCLTYTYSGEWWFLRSYIILVLLSPWIVGIMMRSKRNSNRMFVIATISYMIWGIMSKTHWKMEVYVVDVVKNVLHIYFSFVFGIWMYSTNGFERLRIKLASMTPKKRKWMMVAGILLPIALCVCIKIMFLKAIAIIPLLPFYLMLNRKQSIKRILCYLGHHSTYMWLTHTFFCYYLFHDYIYGLRYPILMYGVLILLALASSYVCQFVHDICSRMLSFISIGRE